MENNEEQRRTLIFALFLNQHYGELVCELFPDYYDKNLKFSDLHIGMIVYKGKSVKIHQNQSKII